MTCLNKIHDIEIIFLIFYLLSFRVRERGRETSICCSIIYAFISWFLYIPWLGIEPTTLVYQDDTNQLSYLARAYDVEIIKNFKPT